MGKKKVGSLTVTEKRSMICAEDPVLSIARQCEVLDLARSTYYYEPLPVDAWTLAVMSAIDEIYMQYPFYGSPKITRALRERDMLVNHKRVARLMRVMGIEAIYQKPRTSVPDPEHRIYPYLLRGLPIVRPDQVWSADITFVRMRGCWMYLMAVIDWYSRYVIAWDVSNTADAAFCCDVLERALATGMPEIFNTDQGATFTSLAFTGILNDHEIKISMDGRGRALDNVFIERLWRSVKYEDIYLKDYDTVQALLAGLAQYFAFFNNKRFHQNLGYQTPAMWYHGQGLVA
jgi:putative transposase